VDIDGNFMIVVITSKEAYDETELERELVEGLQLLTISFFFIFCIIIFLVMQQKLIKIIKKNKHLIITQIHVSYSLSTDRHRTIMTTKSMCEHEVFDKTTRTHRPCIRPATLVVETLIDGVTTQRCCCGQHRRSTIDRILAVDSSQVGHGQRFRQQEDVINTQVLVSSLSDGSVERIHRGTVHFGPVTEMDHLDRLYNDYQDEYCRIGMFQLHHDDFEWRSRYDDCSYHMQRILDRMEEIRFTTVNYFTM